MFKHRRCSESWLAVIALMLLGTACKEETVGKSQSKPLKAAAVADSIAFPSGPEGAAARRGFAILAATRDSMPGYVGANLRCFSCHLDNGRRPNSVPLKGAYGHYPNYNGRSGSIISIQDRVNNCVRRSLAGREIPIDGEQMNAIVMYLAFVARGVPVGGHIPGEGMPTLPDLSGDTPRGAIVYAASCARCHGDDGHGIPPATALWGQHSYAVGASVARLSRAATFIRHNMPFDSAGVLTDQQAFDVAAYILSHPRPDTPGKDLDWAAGDAPRDVPYNTHGHLAFNPAPLLLSAFR